MKFRSIIRALVVCSSLWLPGCALTGTVGVGVERDSLAYTDLSIAMAHARSVLTAIDKKQNELDGIRGLTNAGLYAAGTGAGAAGVFGGSDNIIKGFVVAAGGILGIVDYAQVTQKWGILDNGKEAIFCSIEQTGAISAVKNQSPNLTGYNKPQFFPKLQNAVAALDRPRLTSAQQTSAFTAAMMLGALAEREFIVEQKIQLAMAILDEDEALARTLTLTVERIRAEVEKQLRAASPDPKQIFANQRQTISQAVADAKSAFAGANDAVRDAQSFRTAGTLLAAANMPGFATAGFLEGNKIAEKEIVDALEKLKKVADCLNTVTLKTTPAPNE